MRSHLCSTTLMEETDISQRLQLLTLKTRIYAAAGHPSKGFSIALRSASMAERHFLVPIMFQAIHNLSRILLDHGEYDAVQSICEAALPKVRCNKTLNPSTHIQDSDQYCRFSSWLIQSSRRDTSLPWENLTSGCLRDKALRNNRDP